MMKNDKNLEIQPFPDTDGTPKSTYSPKEPNNVSISEQSVVRLTGIFEINRCRAIIPN